MTQEILLSVKALSRSFDGQKAIEDINFEIHRGEVVALLGANGAGKSTTLNIITGNLAADSGEVRICDTNIVTQPNKLNAIWATYQIRHRFTVNLRCMSIYSLLHVYMV